MKQKNMVRLISVVLLLAFIMSLAGCQRDALPDETRSLDTDTSTQLRTDEAPTLVNEPSSPEAIIPLAEDDVVEIIYANLGEDLPYNGNDIWVDPDSIDLNTYGMKIIERNNKIKELYGIDVYGVTNPSLGAADLHLEWKTVFNSQLDTIDAIYGTQRYDLNLAYIPHLRDVNTILDAEGNRVINLDKAYWEGNKTRELNFGEEVYFLHAFFAAASYNDVIGTFVNYELYEKYVKASFEGKSFFEIIKEGNWTLEAMLRMAEIASENEGVTGIHYDNYLAPQAFMAGLDARLSESRQGDFGEEIVVSDFFTKSFTAFASVMETLLQASYAKGYTYDAERAFVPDMMESFEEGNTLFAINRMGEAKSVKLKGDVPLGHFGVVVMPKLDTSQETYYAAGSGISPVLAISKYSNCPVATAIVVDYMVYAAVDASHVFDAYVTEWFPMCRCMESVWIREEAYRAVKSVNMDFVSAWGESVGFAFDPKATVSDYSDAERLKELFSELPAELERLLEDYHEAKYKDS